MQLSFPSLNVHRNPTNNPEMQELDIGTSVDDLSKPDPIIFSHLSNNADCPYHQKHRLYKFH